MPAFLKSPILLVMRINFTFAESSKKLWAPLQQNTEKARRKNNTVSIITPFGLALIGYPIGEEIIWEIENEKKKYLIKNVSAINL